MKVFLDNQEIRSGQIIPENRHYNSLTLKWSSLPNKRYNLIIYHKENGKTVVDSYIINIPNNEISKGQEIVPFKELTPSISKHFFIEIRQDNPQMGEKLKISPLYSFELIFDSSNPMNTIKMDLACDRNSLYRLGNPDNESNIKYPKTHSRENIYIPERYSPRMSSDTGRYSRRMSRNDRFQQNDYQRNDYQRNDYQRNDYQRNDYQRNDYQRNDYQRNDYLRDRCSCSRRPIYDENPVVRDRLWWPLVTGVIGAGAGFATAHAVGKKSSQPQTPSDQSRKIEMQHDRASPKKAAVGAVGGAALGGVLGGGKGAILGATAGGLGGGLLGKR